LPVLDDYFSFRSLGRRFLVAELPETRGHDLHHD